MPNSRKMSRSSPITSHTQSRLRSKIDQLGLDIRKSGKVGLGLEVKHLGLDINIWLTSLTKVLKF